MKTIRLKGKIVETVSLEGEYSVTPKEHKRFKKAVQEYLARRAELDSLWENDGNI